MPEAVRHFQNTLLALSQRSGYDLSDALSSFCGGGRCVSVYIKRIRMSGHKKILFAWGHSSIQLNHLEIGLHLNKH